MSGVRLIVVPLGGQAAEAESVLVEADLQPGMVRASRAGDALAKSAETLHQSLQRLRTITAMITAELSDLPQRPEHVTVEFGVKLGAEAGLAITKATGEANFKVTLEWGPSEAPAAEA